MLDNVHFPEAAVTSLLDTSPFTSCAVTTTLPVRRHLKLHPDAFWIIPSPFSKWHLT
ncbi:hypothetical protein DPMN_097500 [Dreissena polymorpha]|uniref:Uncharacterized protein n=1 Tax=Dreissena polymorpha TaxID=45954 RepID=A0A9D4R6F1_DREPO|nr:hypothetical protein DPMN_097500 [Dreissena polymorpha]